ncbi:MAG TPA: asparagine synthase (glutamine-hydrolyzing) [Bacteroidia bacterium]|nr:asparagine synthase (glutamine-hydrolyzing) [Bacteroidia bacterium]
MCGIAAIIGFTDKGKERFSRIAQCANLLKHRGPDNQKYIIEPNFAMAHARLSIIDLSEASNQPFTTHDGRFTIVYNGEIFNYKALKNELQQLGHTFYTEGDVEVLINLYKAFGKDGLHKINGFFAFVLYDKQTQTFFAARDRLGIKPFYYYADENYFACSSELGTVKYITDCKAINKTALYTYLQLTYVPEKVTIIQNIYKLEPGEFLCIEKNKITKEKYYAVKLPAVYKEDKNVHKTFYNLLDSAVEARLTADVPVGCFLSGGIDSSVITAIASQKNKSLQTFSIGFKNNAYFDESVYAEAVAKKYNTQHQTFYLSEHEAESEVENFLNAIDEPFADSSAFNVFVLSKKTRQYVKVVLSGDGADELFAGYNKHRAEWMIRHQALKTSLLKSASLGAKLFSASRNSKLSNITRQLERFADGAKLAAPQRYWRWACFYEESKAASLVSLSPKEKADFNELKNAYTSCINTDYNSTLLADVNLVLPGDMLTKVDRMSMANAIEVRNPFLDYRLVEFAFLLREENKIDANIQKKIVKESCAHLLPAEILNRKKHGFETPVQQWLQGVLKSKVEEYCLDKDFIEQQNIFNYNALKNVVKQALSTNAGETTSVVWSVLIFNYWYKQNIL